MQGIIRCAALAVLAPAALACLPALAAAQDKGHPCPAPCPAEVITAPAAKVIVEVPPPEVRFQSGAPAPARHSWCHWFKHHHHRHQAPPITMPITIPYQAPTYSYVPMQMPVMAAPVYSAPVYAAPAAPVMAAPTYAYAPAAPYVPMAPQAPSAPQAPCSSSLEALKNTAASLAAQFAYQQAAAKIELDTLEDRKQALQGQIKALAGLAGQQAPAAPSAPSAPQDAPLASEVSKISARLDKMIDILGKCVDRVDNHEERLKKIEKKLQIGE
jgi:hypothetical protein